MVLLLTFMQHSSQLDKTQRALVSGNVLIAGGLSAIPGFRS